MAKKKYNHYVPKFYMANFSGNSKYIDKCILSSGKIVRGVPTKSTGGKDYLYGKDGVIEDAFSKMESIWASIVRSIIRTEQLPRDRNSIEELLFFIVFSDYRTWSHAQETLELWKTLYQTMARMYKAHGRLDIPDEMIECITAEDPIPNRHAFKHASHVVDCCRDLRIALIKNISDMPFITSDNPAAKYNQLFMERGYFRPYGYGHRGFQLFLPLSPKLCLVLYDPCAYRVHHMHNGKIILKDPKAIRAINTLIVTYADKEIYFSGDTSDRTVQKLVGKRDPGAMCSAVSKWGDTDNSFVFEREPSYWKKLDTTIFTVRKAFREASLPPHMGGPIRPYVETLEEES